MARKKAEASTRGRGRPRIVETPEEFDRLVAEYIAQRAAAKRPLTYSGMAHHLGFSDRQSLYDYERLEGFSGTVKRARLLIDDEYECRLSGNNVAGSIFALKNHGWSDKQEVTVTEKKYVVYATPPVDAEEWRKKYAPSGN